MKPLTTYTRISKHTDLKLRLNNLINNIYSLKHNRAEGAYNYIVIHNNLAFWAKSKPKYKTALTATELIKHLNYLIDNIYVTFGDKLYRQIFGIPMGTNCAVFIANFYLFSYELDYVTEQINLNNVQHIRQLLNTARYIDDIITFNYPTK